MGQILYYYHVDNSLHKLMFSFFSDICKLKYMEKQKNVSEFISLGSSYNYNIQIFSHVLFLLCYVPTLLVGKLISIYLSPLFLQPMYYFFSHLPFMDNCSTSSMTPKLTGDLLEGRKSVFYHNCMWQLFTMYFSRNIEVSILTIMAFDYSVAIYKFHYIFIMNRTRCNLLVLATWAGGALHSWTQFLMATQWPFVVLMKSITNFMNFPFTESYLYWYPLCWCLCSCKSGLVTWWHLWLYFFPMSLFSLRNHSAEGRHKAFSTCGAQITVIVLFLGSSIFAYFWPLTTSPEDKVFTLFYTTISPMFDPLGYLLRNSEMKILWEKYGAKRHT